MGVADARSWAARQLQRQRRVALMATRGCAVLLEDLVSDHLGLMKVLIAPKNPHDGLAGAPAVLRTAILAHDDLAQPCLELLLHAVR